MILIAHRGLLNGPDKSLENNPEQIDFALSLNFDCEIDVWKIDNHLYLGHDYPTYKIEDDYLLNNKLWIHAKNLQAIEWLIANQKDLNFFWHESDKFSITSKKYIWTCHQDSLTDNSVFMNSVLKSVENINCFAVCSDYVSLIST